jgi:glycosyltransferase involved in cell wall biosynthesis
MLDALQRHYGPLARASVVANGRDNRRFGPRLKEPFVFTAGRLWDPAKNVDALRQIAGQLPWPVVAAGDGEPARPLRAVGRLSETDLAAWLGRASIFALPARYEPFGLLPLEAALSGCALVLGDTPSLREVWGGAADYVDPRNTEALRLTLEQLIDSPAHRHARADAAHARALSLGSARMARSYLSAYACACGRGDVRVEMSCAS